MKVAIVGAGVVGLFIGYVSLLRGYEVDIFEKEGRLGKGASGNNAGVVHILQTPFSSLKSQLAIKGNKLHRIYSRNIGYTMRRVNAFLISKSSIHRFIDWFLIGYMDKFGIKARIIDTHDLKTSYPFLSKKIKSAIEVEGYYVIDPMEVLNQLSKEIERFGGSIHYNHGVDEIEISNLKAFIDGLEYDYVILAAGADTSRLATNVGIRPPTQRYARGVMVKTEFFTDAIFAEMRLIDRNKYSKGGGIIPTPGLDATILGPGFRWVNDPYDTQASEEEVEEVLYKFRRLLSIELYPKEVFSGVRIINYPHDDYIFIFNRPIVAIFGIDSPGFTAAPAIAEEVLNKLSMK